MADVPISPKALVTNGELVSATNPLPCVQAASGTPATDVAISPTTFVVDGEIVSATNPLPITLV